jgi:hypothetical protein
MNAECLDSRYNLAVAIYYTPVADSGEAMGDYRELLWKTKRSWLAVKLGGSAFVIRPDLGYFLSSAKGKDTTKSLAERRQRLISRD